MFKFSKIVSAVALAVAGVAANAGVIIDDFSVDQDRVTDTEAGAPGDWSSTNISGAQASILGGYRDLYVEKSGPASGSASVTAVVELGVLSYEQGNAAGVGIVRWDGANETAAVDTDGLVSMGAGADLSVGAIAIRIHVVSADAGFPITLDIWTDALNDGNYVLTSVSQTAPGGAGVVDFTFADIVGANFADVGALQFRFNGSTQTQLDLTIEIVQAVPEPGSLALAGLALAGLGMARRRKAAAK